MANKKMPQCGRCFGQNWIDLGQVVPAEEELIEGELVITSPAQHLFQCGGGKAGADANEMGQGCMRVIRASLDDMKKGGVI
jgi:hypothetical protein